MHFNLGQYPSNLPFISSQLLQCIAILTAVTVVTIHMGSSSLFYVHASCCYLLVFMRIKSAFERVVQLTKKTSKDWEKKKHLNYFCINSNIGKKLYRIFLLNYCILNSALRMLATEFFLPFMFSFGCFFIYKKSYFLFWNCAKIIQSILSTDKIVFLFY